VRGGPAVAPGDRPPGTRVGAYLIVRDEEAQLPDALASLAWADEILVVDSESTDRTVEVARAHGARVLVRTFTDFADQRNFAIDQLDTDWVFGLDADEKVPPGLQAEVAVAVAAPDGPAAYDVPRRNFLGQRWLRYGGLYPDAQTRLFRRGCGRYVGAVHERFVTGSPTGRLTAPLDHRTYKDVADLHAKVARYAPLEGRHLRRDEPLWKLAARVPWRFVRVYLLQQGFRDGRLGLIHAWALTRYAWLVLAAARQARRTPPDEGA